jgi:hypothetical protein
MIKYLRNGHVRYGVNKCFYNILEVTDIRWIIHLNAAGQSYCPTANAGTTKIMK